MPAADLDGRFIFSWIALNALYGQAKYRDGPLDRTAEFSDLESFLKLTQNWDQAAIARIFRDPAIEEGVTALLDDKFLDDRYWRTWDANRTVVRSARQATVLPADNRKPPLIRVFSRLYTLRKQLFHGCSKDGGSKNRGSLAAAVPVLERLVDVCIAIVAVRESRRTSLDDPPYPPSQSE